MDKHVWVRARLVCGKSMHQSKNITCFVKTACRYLCVEVTAPIRTETPIEYGQLYVEAVTLIRKGERYWLNDEDEALLKESNGAFEAQSPLEILLLDTFSVAKEGEEGAILMSMPQLLSAISTHKAFNRRTMNSMVHLGRALVSAGFAGKRRNDGKYYWVKRK